MSARYFRMLTAVVLLCVLSTPVEAKGAAPGPELKGEYAVTTAPLAGVEGSTGAGAVKTQEGGFILSEGEGLLIGVGGGVGNSPYKGCGVRWRPLPLLSYEGDYVYLRGHTAGFKIVNQPHFEVSTFAGYDDTSFASSDSSDNKLRRLKNRQPSAELGLEVRVLVPHLMLQAGAANDVLGHSKGLRGNAGLSMSLEHGSFEFVPSGGIYWSSSRYNDYYYGVSDEEARKSGLEANDPGAGVAPFASALLSYDVADNLGVFCKSEVVFLSRAVKDSPMVDKSRTYNLNFGLMYGF